MPANTEGERAATAHEWAGLLMRHGEPEEGQPTRHRVGREYLDIRVGQQDVHGTPLVRVMDTRTASAIAILVHEKTEHLPNRMSALWYHTARFEEVYPLVANSDADRDTADVHVLFPSWNGWLNIAQDISTHLKQPVYLSDAHLINFAGELASASLILVKYPIKYKQLVDVIYRDGMIARWQYGWSGLLSCFTPVWTRERIYVAMLNGLSVLALAHCPRVADLTHDVRAMMYGYAAFEVSERAVGRRIAQDRKAELLRRYCSDVAVKCRSVGLAATRSACHTLGVPAEASHMDGLPSFSTGCAFLQLGGKQPVDAGDTHDKVEAYYGSSNVWRYPHSHS